MLFFLRLKRNQSMKTKSWLPYLGYAVGEIILVVLGILIAVSIDNSNENAKERAAELESYEDIIADLKEDSVHFSVLIKQCSTHLEYYYHIYEEIAGEKTFSKDVYYDILGVSRDVVPTTEQNHQSTIERLKNKEIRNLLNDYFFRQRLMIKAVEELNAIVVNEARPYIFNNGIVDPALSFHEDLYGFLPKNKQIVNYQILKSHYDDPQLSYLLSTLRISMGHMLSEIKKISELNQKLIQNLEKQPKK